MLLTPEIVQTGKIERIIVANLETICRYHGCPKFPSLDCDPCDITRLFNLCIFERFVGNRRGHFDGLLSIASSISYDGSFLKWLEQV